MIHVKHTETFVFETPAGPLKVRMSGSGLDVWIPAPASNLEMAGVEDRLHVEQHPTMLTVWRKP